MAQHTWSFHVTGDSPRIVVICTTCGEFREAQHKATREPERIGLSGECPGDLGDAPSPAAPSRTRAGTSGF